jgi:peroxiredoxin
VDLVIAMAVNDAAVMRAWCMDQKCTGSMIRFMGDVRCEVTKALGLEFHAVPPKFGYMRCKRFAMVINDGVVVGTNVCAADDDPPGDSVPEKSFVEEVMKIVTA